jgi:hypothetical protein
MDVLSKLSRDTQVVLGGGALLFILSFFDWQAASYSSEFLGVHGSIGFNEWHSGLGVITVLLVIALLAWEVIRLRGANVSIGTMSPGLTSVGLALLVALFTVITFLNWSQIRNWPAWIALIVALIVGAAAVMRARAEGVQMPQGMAVGSGAAAAPAPPAEPAAPAEPNESTDGDSE